MPLKNNLSYFPPANDEEMCKFIGIRVMMDNLQYPRVWLYGDSELGIDFVKNAVNVNRYFKMKTTWHIVNSNQNDHL